MDKEKINGEYIIGPDGIAIREQAAVSITEEEAKSLEDYLECSFLQFIKDHDVDDLEYARRITTVWAKCKELRESHENDHT